MTKDQHSMIRAAIATKKKYGAVKLSAEQKKICEKIAGQKWENMWLGRDNDLADAPVLELNEDGKYIILEEEKAELEAEIAAQKEKLKEG